MTLGKTLYTAPLWAVSLAAMLGPLPCEDLTTPTWVAWEEGDMPIKRNSVDGQVSHSLDFSLLVGKYQKFGLTRHKLNSDLC